MADPRPAGDPYADDIVTSTIHSLWAEPRPPHAPERVWRDWALVAVLVLVAVLEQLLRDDLVWSPLGLLVAVALPFALLWRRTAPLPVVVVAFGLLSTLSIATLTVAEGMIGLDTIGLDTTTAAVLVLPYALARWGAGREVVLGLVVTVCSAVLGIAADDTGIPDAVAGIVVILLFPAAVGASVRYSSNARLRDLEQVRLREREQLARDLHDTVAHHVSAIAIQAQAGRTLAGLHPDRAATALEVIEESASRTLAEMRKMVGVLRDADEPERAPQQGVADIPRLARATGDWPRIDVKLTGDLDDLSPSVGAALYRLAQESITNASRHARHATRIAVHVAGEADHVRLTVLDDGDASAAGRGSTGFGLVGMTERATLLGGTLDAGPRSDQGWTITAVLPRDGEGR
ncbi:histidine kinase [soil metagenome]